MKLNSKYLEKCRATKKEMEKVIKEAECKKHTWLKCSKPVTERHYGYQDLHGDSRYMGQEEYWVCSKCEATRS